MTKLFKTLKKFDKKILLSQYLEESESLLSFFNIYNKICNYFLNIYTIVDYGFNIKNQQKSKQNKNIMVILFVYSLCLR